MLKIVTALAAIGAALVIAGCGSETDTTSDPSTQPPAKAVTVPDTVEPVAKEPQTVDAAKAAATKAFQAYAAGDWAGAWDLFAAKGKAAISRQSTCACTPSARPLQGPSSRSPTPDWRARPMRS